MLNIVCQRVCRIRYYDEHKRKMWRATVKAIIARETIERRIKFNVNVVTH